MLYKNLKTKLHLSNFIALYIIGLTFCFSQQSQKYDEKKDLIIKVYSVESIVINKKKLMRTELETMKTILNSILSHSMDTKIVILVESKVEMVFLNEVFKEVSIVNNAFSKKIKEKIKEKIDKMYKFRLQNDNSENHKAYLIELENEIVNLRLVLEKRAVVHIKNA